VEQPIFRKNGKTVATICSWIRRMNFGRPEMLNVINVDLSGFSTEIAALDTACAAPR
jgi:hypothetical protein